LKNAPPGILKPFFGVISTYIETAVENLFLEETYVKVDG